MTCNATSTCNNCKSTYYLKSGQCFNCPSLPNCQSCDVRASTSCINCVNGYYPSDSGVCTSCPQTGCAVCTSPSVCKTAKDGYFLVVNIKKAYTGAVKTCKGLCATCSKSALSCLTCQSGASLTGTQCISDNNQAITYTGYMNSLGSSSTDAAAQ
jgi:hypothetical protein